MSGDRTPKMGGRMKCPISGFGFAYYGVAGYTPPSAAAMFVNVCRCHVPMSALEWTISVATINTLHCGRRHGHVSRRAVGDMRLYGVLKLTLVPGSSPSQLAQQGKLVDVHNSIRD